MESKVNAHRIPVFFLNECCSNKLNDVNIMNICPIALQYPASALNTDQYISDCIV